MARVSRSLVALAALASFASGCHRKAAAPPAASWYDAKPLLVSLRADERSSAAKNAGVTELDDLPLYDLELTLADDFSKLGSNEEIYFTNTLGVPLDEVAFRIYSNATSGTPRVKLGSGSCKDGPSCTVSQPSPSVVLCKLASPLAPRARVRVTLALDGTLEEIEASRTNMLAQGLESLERMQSGKGGGDYGLLSRGEGIASLASFYAVLARFRDGKWQTSDASTLGDLGADGMSHVRATLTVPSAARVVTSGVIVSEGSAPDDDAGAHRQVKIVAAMVRDFALLVSSRFQSATRKVGDVEVRSHFLGDDRRAGEKVLDAAASSLEAYQKLFGPYPFVDLDVVEAPLVGGAGGVEFSGLVTVASMLYRPAFQGSPLASLAGLLGGPPQKELDQMTDSMLEFTTAHEVAHQYWPGLVGSDSRKHPFMDESLAQWSAVLYFKERYGVPRARLEADREILANYHTMRLLGVPDGAVDRPVDAFKSELAYAGLVYGKGPFYFRALQRKLGDDAFVAALRSYASTHRFRNAPPSALIDSLAKGEQAESVKQLTHRWLDETHGDEDLGKPDLKKLMAAWMGEDAVENMGPALDIAEKLVPKLLGQGAGDGGDDDDAAGDLLKGLLGGGQGKKK
jgi:Peptidase family M1 domain